MSAPEMRKAANAGEQAALLKPSYNAKLTPSRTLKQRSKSLIVALELWGLIPKGFASWLILRLCRGEA